MGLPSLVPPIMNISASLARRIPSMMVEIILGLVV
jgi:hypothetical protein